MRFSLRPDGQLKHPDDTPMSNARLMLILSVVLVYFVGLALKGFLSGSFGGLTAVVWFVPIAFILSTMLAIACGIRRPKP